MAGLEYTLGLKTDAFDRGIKNANAETAAFSKNLHNISQAGEQTGRTVGNSFRELRETAHGAREGMQALSGSMELLGMSVAPQATLAVRTLYESIKALNAASAITGLGLGGLGLAGLGVAAALATVAAGFEAVEASMKEMDSEDALENQYDVLKDKLIPQLEKYMKIGRLDPKIGQGAINLLKGASDENKPHAIKNAQDALRPLIKADKQFDAGEKLDAVVKGQKMITMDPESRAKEEFMMGQDAKFKEAVALAKEAGRPEKPVKEAFNLANQAGLKEIHARFAKEQKDKSEKALRPESPHTAMEKLGFVMKTGAGSHDPAKSAADTARNTKDLVVLMKEILKGGGGGASFGDPLANSHAM